MGIEHNTPGLQLFFLLLSRFYIFNVSSFYSNVFSSTRNVTVPLLRHSSMRRGVTPSHTSLTVSIPHPISIRIRSLVSAMRPEYVLSPHFVPVRLRR